MIIVDDFLPEKYMEDIENILTTRILCKPKDAMLGWTNLSWDDRLKANSALIWITHISEYPHIANAITTELDKKRVCLNARPVVCQICAWHRGSSIPWHGDGHAAFSATLHLRDWDAQHGGLFFWRDPNGSLQVAEPARNRCVIVDQQEEHMVSQVTYDAPGPRFTLQIWGCIPDYDDPKQQQPGYLSYS